jgi:hypothetical protein
MDNMNNMSGMSGMSNSNQTSTTNDIKDFVTTLFEIEYVAHVKHLQTQSFAQHMALGGLYEGIVEHRDSFIESYQGKYGIITGYKLLNPKEDVEIITYLKGVSSRIEAFRSKITDGYLQQIIDDILELIYSTTYKLRFLK